MKLRNPFPPQIRELFRDCWECWKCGENGQRTGGLELHHITGRKSGVAYNAAILCKGCHDHVTHTQEEEAELTHKTIQYLHMIKYRETVQDICHIREHVRGLEKLVTSKTGNQKI